MKERKVFINMILIFILGLFLFIQFNNFYQELNYEFSYKKYINPYELDYSELDFNTTKLDNSVNINDINIYSKKLYVYMISLGVFLILMLNYWFYIVKYFKENKNKIINNSFK